MQKVSQTKNWVIYVSIRSVSEGKNIGLKCPFLRDIIGNELLRNRLALHTSKILLKISYSETAYVLVYL